MFSACCDQRIPHREPRTERHEELVTEIAGVAGARDAHGNAANRDVGATEESKVAHVAADSGREDVARARPLQRDAADRFGLVFDGDVQALSGGLEPAVLWPGSGPEVGAVREQRNGAVIEHAAGLVAPRGVDDLHRLDAIRAAGDHAIDQLGGIGAGQAVLAHWSDIEEGGREADRMVFEVVGGHVGVGDEEARPVAPAACLVEFCRAGVERRLSRHAFLPLCQRLRRYHCPHTHPSDSGRDWEGQWQNGTTRSLWAVGITASLARRTSRRLD